MEENELYVERTHIDGNFEWEYESICTWGTAKAAGNDHSVATMFGGPMSGKLVLSGGLANCGPDVGKDELLDYLMQGTSDISVYKPIYEPGQVYASVEEWKAVLGTAADICTLATVLWGAYQRFVVPRLANTGPKPFLRIALYDQGRLPHPIILNGQVRDEAEFVQEFVSRATVIMGNQSEDIELVFSNSVKWRRIHRDDDSDQ